MVSWGFESSIFRQRQGSSLLCESKQNTSQKMTMPEENCTDSG